MAHIIQYKMTHAHFVINPIGLFTLQTQMKKKPARTTKNSNYYIN